MKIRITCIQILTTAHALFGLLNFANAQSPSAIPYQAVARGASGNLISNQNISLRFTIHDVAANGTVVYQETKSTNTNALGLFNVNIGQGTVVSGTFAGINWASGAKFTQVEIDVTGGTSFVDIGTQQMMSVPYALYAASSGTGGSSQWNTNGNDISNNNTGHIGIGTTTPEFKLSLDTDGGILAKGTFGSGSSLTTSGAGARMIWYPKKASFRAGKVSAAQWNDINIGLYSTAMGINTTASGENSIALGALTTASADYSTALGYNTTASGIFSSAFGAGLSTNLKIGAFELGDASTTTVLNSSMNNEFSSRFEGGYRFFSDATTTEANGLFFTGGKLGIGIGAPNAALQFSNANGNRKIVLWESSNNEHQFNGFGIGPGELRYQVNNTGDNHVFYAGTSATTSDELMRIKGNGNVGIGTNNPQSKLHVFGGNAYLWGLNLGFGTSNAIVTTDAPKPIVFQQAGVEEMRMDASGNLGIGTANPLSKLHVFGADAYLWGLNLGFGTSNAIITTYSGQPLIFQEAGIENMRIDIYGNLGIGTTSPAAKLHVKGNTNGSQLIIDAYATQTNDHPFMRLRSSSGVNLMDIHSDAASNSFIGLNAGISNNVSGGGIGNSFFGSISGYSNTSGSSNTACGENSLYHNISGSENTALGRYSLLTNNDGKQNTASGVFSLAANSTGDYNTSIGYKSLFQNQDGNYNTASGLNSLYNNTSGEGNTASGSGALFNNTTGTSNTGLGSGADVSTNNLFEATALGANATVNATRKVRIGSSIIVTIEGQVAYTNPSDGRFKNNVNENDVKGLQFIKALRPVVYNFDTKKFEEFLTKNMPDSVRIKHFENVDFSESSAVRQSGFIAQEVEQVMKETGYDFNGLHKPVDENDNYGIAYGLFVVPLVKAVQELSKQNEILMQDNTNLKASVEELKTQKQVNAALSDELHTLKTALEKNGIITKDISASAINSK